MTAHPKPKGWGDMLGPEGVWILDSVRIGVSGMKGASPYHYPKPSATPKRGGLFMFFDFGARLRDPGGAPGRCIRPGTVRLLCVAQCSHAVWTDVMRVWPRPGPPRRERGRRRARSRGTNGVFSHFGREWSAFV